MEAMSIPYISETHMAITVGRGDDLNVMIEIPEYHGSPHDDYFMEWIEATKQIFKYREIPDDLNERCGNHKVTSWEKNEVPDVQGFPLSRLCAVLIPKSKTDLTRRLASERVMWNSSINLSSETT